jgi:hypothetical protein
MVRPPIKSVLQPALFDLEAELFALGVFEGFQLGVDIEHHVLADEGQALFLPTDSEVDLLSHAGSLG